MTDETILTERIGSNILRGILEDACADYEARLGISRS
jgi:hypothetical protein